MSRMPRSLRYTARFLALMLIVAAVHAAVAPTLPVNNPYMSALASINAGAAMAIPINCPNNSCGGKKGCRADHGFYCTLGTDGSCATSKCL